MLLLKEQRDELGSGKFRLNPPGQITSPLPIIEDLENNNPVTTPASAPCFFK